MHFADHFASGLSADGDLRYHVALLDRIDHVLAVDHAAEDGILAVQPRSRPLRICDGGVVRYRYAVAAVAEARKPPMTASIGLSFF